MDQRLLVDLAVRVLRLAAARFGAPADVRGPCPLRRLVALAGSTELTAGINAAAFNNLVAAADVDETTAALTQNVKPTGTALGPLSADVQVFALYTQTGTAASAGRAHVIVKYVPNNDPNL